MTNRADGMNYAPQGRLRPVAGPGDFPFAAVALDHGHIHGMCQGLVEAGGEVRWVFDPDQTKVDAFRERFPEARPARSLAEVLDDPQVRLVAGAAVPSERAELGFRAMDAGKDYFTDKGPFTSLDQLERARRKVRETGQKYMVYYSERLHVEAAVRAGELVRDGAIGRVIQVMGTGPHRLRAASRPSWFFEKDKFGGIICDIGSHQVEQLLFFSGASDAEVRFASVANLHHPGHPEFEDFGEVSLLTNNGCSGYFRVDWFTPDGLSTWGDGRMFLLGTDGYIELRKYVDVAREPTTDHLYVVNGEEERHFALSGQVGFPFFGQLILDCLNRTENAMTQQHAFKAAELTLIAQAMADEGRGSVPRG